MRLFIPTSSLNADNILSCESITPTNLCHRREFGYTKFELLNELRSFGDYTLAFSRIPKFDIIDHERANYPMVVEIEIEDVKKSNLVKVATVEDTDVYATGSPIRITPSNCRFLFLDGKHLNHTYYNCSDSAKCKLFDFFEGRMGSVRRSEQGMNLKKVQGLSIPNLEPLYSENDYDRVKGFIWGYIIGTFLSKSPAEAQLLKIQKRVYDIASSIRSEISIPQIFKEELETLDKAYAHDDPMPNLARRKWNEYLSLIAKELGLNEENPNEIINAILIHLKVESEAKIKFLTENHISLRRPLAAYSEFTPASCVQFSTDMERHTKSIINRSRERKFGDNLSAELTIDTRGYKYGALTGDNERNRLFNEVLSNIVWNRLVGSTEEIRINRKEIATEIVKTLKKIIETSGQEWQGSATQDYFDRMRKNISKHEPFNLSDEDNSVLQSVAAFVLKGDDFDSLRLYLETNAMADYRFALALWGAITGFVSIPRALLKKLLSRSEIASIYRLSEEMLGNGNFELPEVQPQPLSFRERVLEYFQNRVSAKSKKERKKLEDFLRDALSQFGDGDNAFDFLNMLKTFEGWQERRGPFKQLQEILCPDYKTQLAETRDRSKKKTAKSKKPSLVDGLRSIFKGYDALGKKEQDRSIEPNEMQRVESVATTLTSLGGVHKHIDPLKEGELRMWIENGFRERLSPSNLYKILEMVDYYVGNYNNPCGQYYYKSKDTESVLRHICRALRKNSREGKYSKNEEVVEDLIRSLKEHYGEV